MQNGCETDFEGQCIECISNESGRGPCLRSLGRPVSMAIHHNTPEQLLQHVVVVSLVTLVIVVSAMAEVVVVPVHPRRRPYARLPNSFGPRVCNNRNNNTMWTIWSSACLPWHPQSHST